MVINFVALGIGYYGLAVFLRPLQEAHDWSNAAVSGATVYTTEVPKLPCGGDGAAEDKGCIVREVFGKH